MEATLSAVQSEQTKGMREEIEEIEVLIEEHERLMDAAREEISRSKSDLFETIDWPAQNVEEGETSANEEMIVENGVGNLVAKDKQKKQSYFSKASKLVSSPFKLKQTERKISSSPPPLSLATTFDTEPTSSVSDDEERDRDGYSTTSGDTDNHQVVLDLSTQAFSRLSEFSRLSIMDIGTIMEEQEKSKEMMKEFEMQQEQEQIEQGLQNLNYDSETATLQSEIPDNNTLEWLEEEVDHAEMIAEIALEIGNDDGSTQLVSLADAIGSNTAAVAAKPDLESVAEEETALQKEAEEDFSTSLVGEESVNDSATEEKSAMVLPTSQRDEEEKFSPEEESVDISVAVEEPATAAPLSQKGEEELSNPLVEGESDNDSVTDVEQESVSNSVAEEKPTMATLASQKEAEGKFPFPLVEEPQKGEKKLSVPPVEDASDNDFVADEEQEHVNNSEEEKPKMPMPSKEVEEEFPSPLVEEKSTNISQVDEEPTMGTQTLQKEEHDDFHSPLAEKEPIVDDIFGAIEGDVESSSLEPVVDDIFCAVDEEDESSSLAIPETIRVQEENVVAKAASVKETEQSFHSPLVEKSFDLANNKIASATETVEEFPVKAPPPSPVHQLPWAREEEREVTGGSIGTGQLALNPKEENHLVDLDEDRDQIVQEIEDTLEMVSQLLSIEEHSEGPADGSLDLDEAHDQINQEMEDTMESPPLLPDIKNLIGEDKSVSEDHPIEAPAGPIDVDEVHIHIEQAMEDPSRTPSDCVVEDTVEDIVEDVVKDMPIDQSAPMDELEFHLDVDEVHIHVEQAMEDPIKTPSDSVIEDTVEDTVEDIVEDMSIDQAAPMDELEFHLNVTKPDPSKPIPSNVDTNYGNLKLVVLVGVACVIGVIGYWTNPCLAFSLNKFQAKLDVGRLLQPTPAIEENSTKLRRIVKKKNRRKREIKTQPVVNNGHLSQPAPITKEDSTKQPHKAKIKNLQKREREIQASVDNARLSQRAPVVKEDATKQRRKAKIKDRPQREIDLDELHLLW